MKYIIKFGAFTFLFLLVACTNDDEGIKTMQAQMIKQQEVMINNLKEELVEKEKTLLECEGGDKGGDKLSKPIPKPKSTYFFARGKGMFPEGSERRLTNDDVTNLSSRELKIMRNEIFARHGYIFKTNDMKVHFASQPWYTPMYDNVTIMLSKIEEDNVRFIQLYE